MTAACARCGDPLDKILPEAGFTTHPWCDPGEVSELWPPETAGDPATLLRAEPWRLLITCSRTWDIWDAAITALQSVLDAHPAAVLVSGAAPRGDAHLERIWSRLLGMTWDQAVEAGRIERHEADWDRDPRGAGFARNLVMVDAGADECLAFVMPCTRHACRRQPPHGTHGASHCATQADAAGIPVRRITEESCRLQETPQDQETRP